MRNRAGQSMAGEAGRSFTRTHAIATVTTYFDRGLVRRRSAPLAVVGQKCTREYGGEVQFTLEVDGDLIREVSFTSTTCVTLVAYAELLSEWVTGATLAEAIRLTPGDLIRALTEVPPLKQNRAELPICALQRAIQAATDGDSSSRSRAQGGPR